MSLDPQIIVAIVGAIFGGAVAWGGAQAGAKTTTREVRSLVRRFEAHEKEDHDREVAHVGRLSAVETLLGEVHRAVVKK